jgi:hypothetical protein
MTSGIGGPWRNQPTLVLVLSGSWQTKPRTDKGLIGRRWALKRTALGELEAAFYHEARGKKQGF